MSATHGQRRMKKMPSLPAMPRMNRMMEMGEQIKGVYRQRGGSGRRGPSETVIGGRYAPEMPGWWEGSDGEWAVYWALISMGRQEGVDFEFIAQVGEKSRGETGYVEADFLVPEHMVAIQVHGEYFHYHMGKEKIAFDEIQYAQIAGTGYIPVVIDVQDALNDPIYYTREALQGIDHSSRPR